MNPIMSLVEREQILLRRALQRNKKAHGRTKYYKALSRVVQQTKSQTNSTLQSRLEYASRLLITEIEKGYFLPFCMFAISNLARQYVLLSNDPRHL